MVDELYNPLDKFNLARSIEGELLKRPAIPLEAIADIQGAGVYAIYYAGNFRPYRRIALANLKGAFQKPIYVGKAIPKGGRKGGLTKTTKLGKALADRLKQHSSSIDECANLNLGDFFCRYLVVDDIWIPLGENVLIGTFEPIWNRAIDGFGNKDPGKRRATQYTSPWDVLHPGRHFARKLANGGLTPEFLVQRVEDYLAGRPMAPLPKAVAKQQADLDADAKESADEA